MRARPWGLRAPSDATRACRPGSRAPQLRSFEGDNEEARSSRSMRGAVGVHVPPRPSRAVRCRGGPDACSVHAGKRRPVGVALRGRGRRRREVLRVPHLVARGPRACCGGLGGGVLFGGEGAPAGAVGGGEHRRAALGHVLLVRGGRHVEHRPLVARACLCRAAERDHSAEDCRHVAAVVEVRWLEEVVVAHAEEAAGLEEGGDGVQCGELGPGLLEEGRVHRVGLDGRGGAAEHRPGAQERVEVAHAHVRARGRGDPFADAAVEHVSRELAAAQGPGLLGHAEHLVEVVHDGIQVRGAVQGPRGEDLARGHPQGRAGVEVGLDILELVKRGFRAQKGHLWHGLGAELLEEEAEGHAVPEGRGRAAVLAKFHAAHGGHVVHHRLLEFGVRGGGHRLRLGASAGDRVRLSGHGAAKAVALGPEGPGVAGRAVGLLPVVQLLPRVQGLAAADALEAPLVPVAA
mmetsp:Transcript_1669/g.5452  ORF Transcript_1669/g.5452 Transcript_1669/m.5452 type:complete len:461 (+) Transcript_1669:193-1575(+)